MAQYSKMLLKGTTATLTKAILDFSALSDTNPQIVPSNSYDKYPHHFHRGKPLPGWNTSYQWFWHSYHASPSSSPKKFSFIVWKEFSKFPGKTLL